MNIIFAIIDTGTTNTRVYIMNDANRITGKAYNKIGVKDVVAAGSKEILIQGISQCFYQALEKSNAKLSEIKFAVGSGMLTSEIGLMDIPHLVAPAGLSELASNMRTIHDIKIFPIDIPLFLIPGVKNNDINSGISQIRTLDFMKGEETQVMGLLENLKPNLPVNILVLSSHTKLIHVNKQGKIAGSMTTLSGQLYEAIKKETSIGKSIVHVIAHGQEEFFSQEILEAAYETVQNAGFLRACLMPRFMEVLLHSESFERKFFIEAAIASDDVKILDEIIARNNFTIGTDFIFVGQKSRCILYEKLFRKKGMVNSITYICEQDDIDSLGITGATKVIKERLKKENI